MLFGMVIADVNEQQIWVGAVGGLLTHRIVSMILVGFRNYIYGFTIVFLCYIPTHSKRHL